MTDPKSFIPPMVSRPAMIPAPRGIAMLIMSVAIFYSRKPPCYIHIVIYVNLEMRMREIECEKSLGDIMSRTDNILYVEIYYAMIEMKENDR